jgi:hypothetical protein
MAAVQGRPNWEEQEMEWYLRTGGALLLAAGLAIPAVGQESGTPAPAPITREMLRTYTPSDLLRGLDEIDFEAVRANPGRYRLVQAERVMAARDVDLLRQLIANDSVARRNQALLNGLLRGSQAITSSEQVVGVLPERNLIYVLGSGTAAPGAENAVFLRPAIVEADPAQLARGLTTADFQAIRYGLPEYRTVDAGRVLTRRQLQMLERLIDQDSLARRNRDLITNLLRDSKLITSTQRVVGVTEDPKALFVVSGR